MKVDRLGYIEGKNLIVERFSVLGRHDRTEEIARAIVGSRPDLILLIQINGEGAGKYPGSCFHTEWEEDMPESVYDVILLIGSSKESWEKAAANAVEQASKSLRNLRVAEIVELDMQLDAKGKVEAYRAKVRLSFKVER